jgi:hypothetical protein
MTCASIAMAERTTLTLCVAAEEVIGAGQEDDDVIGGPRFGPPQEPGQPPQPIKSFSSVKHPLNKREEREERDTERDRNIAIAR